MYIVHASKYTKRRHRLERILNKSDLRNVVWMSGFDKEDLSYDRCRCIFSPSYSNCTQPIEYGVANAWSQYALYYHMVRRNIPHALVMEDDPYFKDKQVEDWFNEDLADMMFKAESLGSWDMIHFGGCLGIHAYGTGLRPHPNTGPNPYGRCSNGYAVSLDGAKKMLSVLRNTHSAPLIYKNVDLMFNDIGAMPQPGCEPLQVYLLEPPLFWNDSVDNNGAAVASERRAVDGQYTPTSRTFKKISFGNAAGQFV